MNTYQPLLRAAQDAGLLPADGQATPDDGPSWIVASMGYLGALLVALLSLGVLALISWGGIFSLPGSIITALAFTAAGIALLRGTHALFREQLAFSALLIGQAMWLAGWGLNWATTSRLGVQAPLLGLLALQLVATGLTSTPWVIRLLGIAGAWTFLAIPLGTSHQTDVLDLLWQGTTQGLNLWALSLAWAACCIFEVRLSTRAWGVRVSALADGVAVALLLQPLIEYALSGIGLGSARFLMHDAGALQGPLWQFSTAVAVRMALILACAAWLMLRHWPLAAEPALRRAWPLLIVSYALLLLACWFTPVEAIAIVGTVALGTGRKRLLWLALLALLLQLASFYYQLNWSLMDKARTLLGAGAILASVLIGLHHLRKPAGEPMQPGTAPISPRRHTWQGALMLATALLAVGGVQWDVQRKEAVIAHGQKVFVRLAPLDPRSLMQGDYMALNFDLPAPLRQQLAERTLSTATHVVAQLDTQGVARIVRLAAAHEHPAQGELLLPLKYLKGRWTLVTDAYFFPEGQADRYTHAAYGEFRVLPSGQALLVGLATDALQPIAPAPAKTTP